MAGDLRGPDGVSRVGSVAVALSTQSHHAGSFPVPGEAWLRREPGEQSYVLPWTIATLKNDLHVVGQQGSLTDELTEQVSSAPTTYADNSVASSSP